MGDWVSDDVGGGVRVGEGDRVDEGDAVADGEDGAVTDGEDEADAELDPVAVSDHVPVWLRGRLRVTDNVAATLRVVVQLRVPDADAVTVSESDFEDVTVAEWEPDIVADTVGVGDAAAVTERELVVVAEAEREHDGDGDAVPELEGSAMPATVSTSMEIAPPHVAYEPPCCKTYTLVPGLNTETIWKQKAALPPALASVMVKLPEKRKLAALVAPP